MRSNAFYSFIISKHFCWQDISQEFSDRLMEDEFNSPIAEEALDIAFDVYPDGSDEENELMEKRHEFVSDFMEYCRCEYIRETAGNLDMVNRSEYEKQSIADARVSIHGKASYYRGRRDAMNEFAKISGYAFSKWKLQWKGGFEEKIPQDSEDEAWEQLKAFAEVKTDV